MEQWRKKSKEAREAFHSFAGKAAELQWELGPQFLVAFERVCREQGRWVRTIPWDPARMVGWKIMVSQVRIDPRDLKIVAQELAPGAADADFVDGRAASVADGSYFTDYVHHIAISRLGFSPRAVTRDLMARLLRPAEMMTLIASHSGQSPAEADALHLADDLLNAFGWRRADEEHEKPLAACIRIWKQAQSTVSSPKC